MASKSPSPNSSPNADPPASPLLPLPDPDQIIETPSPSAPPPPPPPSSSSAPPPQSSPPPSPSAPPPSPPQSPPPESPPPPPPPESPQSPAPPESPQSPPPPESLPSPPPPPESPPLSPPPAPPTAPPPATNPPPTPTNSSPPPTSPPPPPSGGSPPEESPAPPVASPPLPPAISSSPPPPATDPPPPTMTPPPPPVVHPPKRSPSPPEFPPPPIGSPPIPPTSSPSPPSTVSPPPVPLSPFSPSGSPPSPSLTNTSANGRLPASPLPSHPTEKPTAKSTQTADSTSKDSRGLKPGGVAAIVSTVGFLALTLVILAVWFTHRRKKRKNGFTLNYAMPSPFASSQNSDSSFLRSHYSAQLTGSASANNYMYSPDGGIGASRSWFTYQELSAATNGFSSNNLLGEGGFGCVYKGVLADGREVAVKQLKAGGGQGEREFRAEVEIISRIHHRHLVSLVGYCISENQRLLVYDYVPNNTLHYHLHAAGEGKTVMDWASRVKVAAGAARGLAYLHEDCQPRIIHRDIKSTNILLDNNFDARVADFGLAKLALELDLHTHVSTRVMGTFGYLAPEYASTGKLTEKSDVFSFGVMLLELITGRKPVDSSQPLGDESLVEWARPLLTEALDKEEFADLVDPRLENSFVPSEMFRMIEAAAACVRHLASKRPRMSQVVRALDSMEELADLNNGMKPGESGIFSSKEHSAQIRMFQRMAFGSQDYSSDYFNDSQTSWRS